MAITRGWSSTAQTTAVVTSLTVDITGATAGEWVYAWCNWRSTQLISETFTGWTNVEPYQKINGVGGWALYKRLVQSGDTTFTLSWTTSGEQCLVLLQQYPGTIGDENSNLTIRSGVTNNYVTAAISPTDSNRWFVGFYGALSTSTSFRTLSWTGAQDTTTTAQTAANTNGTLAWLNAAIFDSNGPVSNASHTGEGDVTSGSSANGAACGIFLIPQVDITITGVVAATTTAAPAGSVSVTGAATIGGPVAAVTTAAPAGTVTTTSNVTISGVVAATTTAAPAGAISKTVTGVIAAASTTAPAGTVTAVKNVTITGVVSTVTTAATPGSITRTTNITGVVTGLTTAAPAGSITTAGNVTISGTVATTTTGAPAGTITGSANITGTLATVTTAAAAGTIHTSVTIAGTPAQLATTAPAGTVDTAGNISLPGQPANLTTSAPPGTVTVTSSVQIGGDVARTVTAAPSGTVTANVSVTINGVTASITTTAFAGAVLIKFTVEGRTLRGQTVGHAQNSGTLGHTSAGSKGKAVYLLTIGKGHFPGSQGTTINNGQTAGKTQVRGTQGVPVGG